jgi:hypothetical protein
MIDIEQLLPDYITAQLWDMSFVWERVWNKYIIKETIWDHIDIDEVSIYVNDKLFDKINKQILLQPWDTLYLEYQIDVCEKLEQNIR